MAARIEDDQGDEGSERLFTILAIVAGVPKGQAMSYGEVAAIAGATAREVGHVMAQHGDDVPWHRIVHADGSAAAPHLAERQIALLAAEGVPFKGRRVDLAELRRRGTERSG